MKLIKKRGGFTLVEVLAAFGLLAICAAVCAGVFASSNKMIGDSVEMETENQAVIAYIRSINARDGSLVTEIVESDAITFEFAGRTVTAEGKTVVFVYSGGSLVEYKIFERDG